MPEFDAEVDLETVRATTIYTDTIDAATINVSDAIIGGPNMDIQANTVQTTGTITVGTDLTVVGDISTTSVTFDGGLNYLKRYCESSFDTALYFDGGTIIFQPVYTIDAACTGRQVTLMFPEITINNTADDVSINPKLPPHLWPDVAAGGSVQFVIRTMRNGTDRAGLMIVDDTGGVTLYSGTTLQNWKGSSTAYSSAVTYVTTPIV